MCRKFWAVWIVFILYAAGYFAVCTVFRSLDFAWLGLSLFSLAVSVYLLAEHQFPSRKQIAFSCILTLLYFPSKVNGFNAFSVIQTLGVFLSICASCRVFAICGKNGLKWLRRGNGSGVLVSMLIGLLAGAVWGFINYLLMRGNNPRVRTNVFPALLMALNPAIAEEITYRAVFYAFCLSMAGGALRDRFQRFTGWFMMIVPHILPHILFDASGGIIRGILSWFLYLAMYIVVFGFIFAFLQKKRDITSAMIAHGTVDFIRFLLFGLP